MSAFERICYPIGFIVPCPLGQLSGESDSAPHAPMSHRYRIEALRLSRGLAELSTVKPPIKQPSSFKSFEHKRFIGCLSPHKGHFSTTVVIILFPFKSYLTAVSSNTC